MKEKEIRELIEKREDEECELLIWLEIWKDASYEKLIEKHAKLEMPLKRYSEGEEAYKKVQKIIIGHFESGANG